MWKEPERNTISLGKCETGRVIEGTYTGQKIVDVEGRDSSIWQFADDEEKPFGVWGCTSLDSRMEGIKVGSAVRITCLGKATKAGKFGKFPILCKVEVWEGDDNAKPAA